MKPDMMHVLSDFIETSSLGSPTLPSGRQSPVDRRQTILSLVEMLLQQNAESRGTFSAFLIT